MDDVCAVTRNITVEMAERAYRQGIFPMGYPGRRMVTWHKPDPRAVLPLDRFHVSRSLARRLKKPAFTVTYDRDFIGVMRACATRGSENSTWITPDFFKVYGELHAAGKAHSVEVWRGEDLVGGVYGVHLGAAFFAESKFHRETDMSKVALAKLVERLRERGFLLLEVQYWTEHLAQFGVIEVPFARYAALLEQALAVERQFS
jgi:leucyl/phenylalanyl-tRNA--protein transferase